MGAGHRQEELFVAVVGAGEVHRAAFRATRPAPEAADVLQYLVEVVLWCNVLTIVALLQDVHPLELLQQPRLGIGRALHVESVEAYRLHRQGLGSGGNQVDDVGEVSALDARGRWLLG